MADSTGTLSEVAKEFYEKLPEADYPKALIEGYPRIANRIISLRNDKPALAAYFDSLLADTRGGRQGFPFAVLVNVQNMFDILIGIPDGFVDTDVFFAGLRKKK